MAGGVFFSKSLKGSPYSFIAQQSLFVGQLLFVAHPTEVFIYSFSEKYFSKNTHNYLILNEIKFNNLFI